MLIPLQRKFKVVADDPRAHMHTIKLILLSILAAETQMRPYAVRSFPSADPLSERRLDYLVWCFAINNNNLENQ